jgi:hypothetical protein
LDRILRYNCREANLKEEEKAEMRININSMDIVLKV